jgi:hypothetical protein
MQLQDAKYRAIELFGPNGTARTVRYVDTMGHYRLDYRVGICVRGRYEDYGRGSSFDAAFDQVQKEQECRALRKATGLRGAPLSARYKLLKAIIEERERPVLRAHDLAVGL